MSRRIDKKKQKRQTETANTPILTAVNAAETSVPVSAVPVSGTPAANVGSDAGQIDFFIQYQNEEYLEKDIIDRIKEKCKQEGKEVYGSEKLSVYLKPEDKKAYFTYAGFSSFVEV